MPTGNFGSTNFGSSASGTTIITRNELIEIAYRKIGITVNTTLYDRASVLLNLIIREEDLKGTKESTNLWALYEDYLFLAANEQVYEFASGLSDGIVDLRKVTYRDIMGIDYSVDIITARQYEAIPNKYDVGIPKKVYLKQDKDLSLQQLYVWPMLASVGPTTIIAGSDTNHYSCIKGHEPTFNKLPIIGTDWRMYWTQKGTVVSIASGNPASGELLKLLFKRPLYSFTSSGDNPDMPTGWTRYLIYRLAHDLCAEQKIPMEERAWLKLEYLEAYNTIFPSLQPVSDDFHNKGCYF